jgi:hypothetical protein
MRPSVQRHLLFVIFLPLIAVVVATAQTPPTVRALVTDQTSLGLPNNFGPPSYQAINQAGDFVFTSDGEDALFLRKAGSPAAVRLFQMGEPIPGFSGSLADIISTVKINSSGVIAVRVEFYTDRTMGAILTYNGSTFHTIACSTDVAPGTGGAVFGRTLTLIGINDAGDVAFTSSLANAPSINTSLALPTLFIAPAGGAPVRLIGKGDAGPGTGGTLASPGARSLNNRGEVVFASAISGGNGGNGIFVASTAGVRKVVATGDAFPGGTTFAAPGTATSLLNNSGDVVFGPASNTTGSATNAIFLQPAANPGSIVRLVGAGDAAPADIGGTLSSTFKLLSFSDADTVAVSNSITGRGWAMFRLVSGSSLQTIAAAGQAAPGAGGKTFTNFYYLTMNASGEAAFIGMLSGTPVAYGIFRQAGANPMTLVAVDGDAAPLTGGGTLSCAPLYPGTMLLDSGSLAYWANIVGGAADYAQFLATQTGTAVLLTTADTLPSGSRIEFRGNWPVYSAGSYVGFSATRTGGITGLYVYALLSG